ncbi:putative E3 ubiquitin-protein ligase [Halotydeus destructor]|nr:putative E3 ubiquitin-protein ligase [Halotydeus destructor]
MEMESNGQKTEEIKKASCSFFVKKSGMKFKSRRRRDQNSSDSDSSDDETQVVSNSRKRKSNPLVQSTGSFSGAKKRQDDTFPVSASYESTKTGEREGPSDMGATSTIQMETEKDKDARTIFEKAQKINEEMKGKDDDKVYRGMNNYKQYITVKDTAQGNAALLARKGPVRAPENIRSTVRWDYQPNLCKDYKETGFCGFGDSCIFLHDRTDYKQGWQIELEMAKGVYGQDDGDDTKYEINEEEHLPFKCLFCRESFVKPIVTKCKHYFCEKCALDHYRKSTRCFVCGVQTHGIFNPAKEIAKRIASRPEEEAKADSENEFEPLTEMTTEQTNEDEASD